MNSFIASMNNIVKTENGANCYDSLDNPLVELFFKTLRGCSKENMIIYLEKAWNYDKLKTLKIIYQTRDCRGGKGEREQFINQVMWLRENHKSTYDLNIKKMIDYGCYVDLLKICSELKTEGSSKSEQHLAKPKVLEERKAKTPQMKGIIDKAQIIKAHEYTAEITDELEILKNQLEQDLIAVKNVDPKAKKPVISLAGKWAPTERTHFDHNTNGRLAQRLAQLMFPYSLTPNKDYRLMITKLRNHLKVVETLMCAGEWDKIDYEKVPSRTMMLNRAAFKKHDEERFGEYLKKLAQGKAKVNAKGVQIHELTQRLMTDRDQVLESQIDTIISKLKESGDLGKCIAISDVSGSMSGIPIQVSIALGLVVSELAHPAFRNHLLTFSENPEWHKVVGRTYYDKLQSISNMNWGGSTNFESVFELILSRAVANKVPQEEMPTTLFVFSDMQFNEACSKPSYGTLFETYKIKFQENGYNMPQIVFWNLRADTVGFPIASANEPNVAMISGFSSDLLKVFMVGKPLTPLAILDLILDSYPITEDMIGV